MSEAILDYQRVRAQCKCPLCGGIKDKGLIACWSCYRREDMRNGGNRVATVMLDHAEMLLAEGGAL
jgi:hypothetical protein